MGVDELDKRAFVPRLQPTQEIKFRGWHGVDSSGARGASRATDNGAMTAHMTQDDLKRAAGKYAAELVENGMVVGLGEGSTAWWAIEHLAHRLRAGEVRDIAGIPCSRSVEAHARAVGLPITDFERCARLDLTIDGADEVDVDCNLIKGGGGALLREKVVAENSRREVIVVDASKRSDHLGTRWAVPIEVVPFAVPAVERAMVRLGGAPTLRKRADGQPYVTDQGNAILDTRFGPIPDAPGLARRLDAIAGVVEHGLFIGLVHDLIIASPGGISHKTVRVPERLV